MSTEQTKRWSLLETHKDKVEKASFDPEYLKQWKVDLTSRANSAAEGNNLKLKFETLGEFLMLGLAETALGAALKTKSLAVVMRDRHGIKNEELDKWLNGTSLTPSTFSQAISLTSLTNSKQSMTSLLQDLKD